MLLAYIKFVIDQFWVCSDLHNELLHKRPPVPKAAFSLFLFTQNNKSLKKKTEIVSVISGLYPSHFASSPSVSKGSILEVSPCVRGQHRMPRAHIKCVCAQRHDTAKHLLNVPLEDGLLANKCVWESVNLCFIHLSL